MIVQTFIQKWRISMISSLEKLAKLDDIDFKILTVLMEDARLSMNKIAEKIGISVATVSARVKKLESLGVIERYTIYVNCKTLGFQASAIFLIKVSKNIEEVGRLIAELNETRAVYRVTGRFDLAVHFSCITIDSLAAMIDKIKKIPNVEDVETMVILDILKDRPHPSPEVIKKASRMALGEK